MPGRLHPDSCNSLSGCSHLVKRSHLSRHQVPPDRHRLQPLISFPIGKPHEPARLRWSGGLKVERQVDSDNP